MSARTGKFKPLPLPATGIETESFILTPDGPGKFWLQSKLSGEGMSTDMTKVDALLNEFFEREF